MAINARMILCIAIAAMLAPITLHAGETVDLPDGSKLDTSQVCPVCQMKVESGALGHAAAVFNDGKVVGFDGPGDLFRYLLEPAKYGFDKASIKHLYVTEYGSPKLIDAKTAFFVVGSDYTGNMGPEVAPFSTKDAAEKFKTEHKGRAVSAFAEVSLSDLTSGKKKLKMKHDHGK